MATVEHYLDPLTQAFSPEVARRILDRKSDERVLARVEELGLKSNAGTITDVERDEYRSLADAGTHVALLKAKPRRFLAQSSVLRLAKLPKLSASRQPAGPLPDCST